MDHIKFIEIIISSRGELDYAAVAAPFPPPPSPSDLIARLISGRILSKLSVSGLH